MNKVLGKAKMPIGAAAAAMGVPEQQLLLLAQQRRDHETRVCSFCAEQGELVAGPDVNICWSCVPLVAAVGEGREADPSVPMWIAAADEKAGDSSCSFCGKSPRQTTYQVRGLSASICNECIGLCDEIIAESEIA